jgi:hypothetical protein
MGINHTILWKKGIIISLTLIFVGLFILTLFPTTIHDKGFDNQTITHQEEIIENKIDQKNGLMESDTNQNNTLPQTAGSDIWWNEDFDSRKELTITEPGIGDRIDEVISFWTTFEEGKCHKNTTRIVYFDGNTQSEIPSQISNQTYWPSSDYLKYVTISFQASIQKNGNKTFYLYYSSTAMNSKNDEYMAQNGMSLELINGRVKIDTGALYYELSNETGFDVIKYSSEKLTGINYHSPKSMSPLSIITNGTNYQTYSPNSYGYFYDWLIAGPFAEGTSTFSAFPTASNLHVDPTVLYGDGDNVRNGNPTIYGSDPSKKWFIHNDADYTIDIDSTIFPSIPENQAIYALCYAYFPQDEPNVYIKVGSSDGIRVIYDGRKGESNVADFISHTTRATASDSNVWKIGETVTKGWHRFYIMLDYTKDDMSFRFRLSRAGGTTYTAIPGLLISLNPQTNIENISIIENGPIYSTIKVNWYKSGDMRTTENITFYHGLYNYKSTRTFFWEKQRNLTAGNTWSAINTYYQTTTTTGLDELNVDGQLKSLSSTDINANKYVMVRDNSGDAQAMVQGIFITNISKNSPDMTFSLLNMTYKYNANQPCIIPGFKTDLDNKGTHIYEVEPQYSVNVEFWEMTKKYIGVGVLSVKEELDLIYTTMKTPLFVSINVTEQIFFNLGFQLLDADNEPAKNVEVTIFKTTGNNFERIYPYYKTKIADTVGQVSFSKMALGNYSCLISFKVYQKPTINLTWVNVTLNQSKIVTVPNLNLTKFTISLIDSLNPENLIIGANVSYFWNNSNPAMNIYGGYIGSEISDEVGQVSFYYLNASESEGNYSIKVYYYGDFRVLSKDNVAFESNKMVNYTLDHFRIEMVYVQLESFNSFLTQNETLGYGTHYWGENITLTYNFTYQYGAEPLQPISNAILNFAIKSKTHPELGNLIVGIINETTNPGIYQIKINTSDPIYRLNTRDYFSFIMTAEKAGYIPVENWIEFRIKNITSALELNTTNINSVWTDNFTVQATFWDVDKAWAINDVNMTYSCVQIPSIFGSLNPNQFGNETYSLELNTSIFMNTGLFTIKIVAYKEYYELITQDIYVTINKISTSLSSEQLNYDITWEEIFKLNVTFQDTSHGRSIENANVTFWILQIPELTGPMGYNDSGKYSVELNSTQFYQPGNYIIRINAILTHYDSKTIDIPITIHKISTFLSTNETYYIITWNDKFQFNASFKDITNNRWITDANLTFSVILKPEINGTLIYKEFGVYLVEMNSTLFNHTGTYFIRINAIKNNYESKFLDISITINPVSTSLFADQLEYDLTWNELFIMNTTFRDISHNSWIIDANLTYMVIQLPGITGNLGYIGTGKYSIELNTTIFNQTGTYLIRITAELQNYITKTVEISIKINQIATSLITIQNNIELTWKENFTMNVTFRDTSHDIFIENANVTFFVVQLPMVKGTLGYFGSGKYSIELNTTIFNQTGTFLIRISAESVHYDSKTLEISLKINPIATLLTADDLDFELIWIEKFTINVTFIDISHGLFIEDGIVTYSVLQLPLINGSMSSIGMGKYSIELNTTQFNQIGSYILRILATHDNYNSKMIEIAIVIREVQTSLTADLVTYEITWLDNLTITANFTDISHNNWIEDASVTFSAILISDLAGSLNYDGLGIYSIELNSTQFYQAGTFFIRINAIKGNYKTQFLDISIVIKKITTSLTTNQSYYEISWPESFVINTTFEDLSHNRLINGANLTFLVIQQTEINGTMTSLGSGLYTIELNSTLFHQSGTYLIRITTTLNNYETIFLEISLKILITATTLTFNQTNFVLNWANNFSIDLYFKDTSNNRWIEDGIIIYSVLHNPDINGTLLYIEDGHYGVEINSTIFQQAGTYIIRISISNYPDVIAQDIVVNINKITTKLTVDKENYELTWAEYFVINATFEDTTNHQFINDGNISFYVIQFPEITGILSPIGAGRYSIELNSTQFQLVGYYTIRVIAQKDQFHTQSIDCYIRIQNIVTKLNNTIFMQINEKIFVGRPYEFYFLYQDNKGVPIEGANNYYFEWQLANTTETTISPMLSHGNGIFALNFHPESRQIGTYIIIVHIEKSNYVERIATLTLEIIERPILILNEGSMKSTIIESSQGENIHLEFRIFDETTQSSLTNATVKFNYLGKEIKLSEIEPGVYTGIIRTDSGDFNAFVRTQTVAAVLTIEKADYASKTIDFTLSVSPPEYVIAGMKIPKIYVIIGGGIAILLGSLWAMIAIVHYARIPKIIKRIRETKAIIQKNRFIAKEEIVRTWERIVYDIDVEEWNKIDEGLGTKVEAKALISAATVAASTDSMTPSDIKKEGGKE